MSEDKKKPPRITSMKIRGRGAGKALIDVSDSSEPTEDNDERLYQWAKKFVATYGKDFDALAD